MGVQLPFDKIKETLSKKKYNSNKIDKFLSSVSKFLLFLVLKTQTHTHTHTHTIYIGLMKSFICPKQSRALCLKGEGSGLTHIHYMYMWKVTITLLIHPTWKSHYKTSTLYNLFKVANLQNIVESNYNSYLPPKLQFSVQWFA
jgi:hypothetical protein